MRPPQGSHVYAGQIYTWAFYAGMIYIM